MENKTKIISNDDILIELQYNPNLENNQYLCKIYSYFDYMELRLSSSDLLGLSESMKNFVENNNTMS